MKYFILVVAILFAILAAGYYFWGRGGSGEELKNGEPALSNGQPGSPSESGTPKAAGGLKIETLKEGSGEGAKSGDLLTVHYVGTLANGQKFDSSRDRKAPFQFVLGAQRVIPGWESGLLGMKKGEERRITIPPELAYGASGTPGGPIPPNATLIFEVELLKIGE